MDTEKLSGNFKKELEAISKGTILNTGYRRKKLILWIVRTIISITLYILFWKYSWIKWTLLLTVPLSLFSLLSIIGWNYFLNKKVAKTNEKLEKIDKLIEEEIANHKNGI